MRAWKNLLFLAFCFVTPTLCNKSMQNVSYATTSSQSALVGKTVKDKECRDYHDIRNSSKWCSFVSVVPDCAMDEGFLNYIKIAFCHFEPKYLPAVSVVYALWLLFLFIGLGTVAEGFFCPSLEFIARNLKLSHNIAGLTIVAFGNGAPDIFSAIAAFTNSNPTTAGVAIGALLGAALLVTTVVAGLVATTQPFDVARRPFLRDMIFFLATVFWLFCLLFVKKISLPHSIGFLVLYLVYVATALIGRFINQRQRAKNAALKESGSINKPEPDESSPLLGSDSESPLSEEQADNNNVDNGEWMDVNLRSHPKDNLVSSEEERTRPDETRNTDEDSEDDDGFEDKSTIHILLTGLNPLNISTFKKANCFMKLLYIFQIPWNFVCNLTIPLIIVDHHRRAWNRPLHSLCLIIAPVFCVFATKGNRVNLGNVFPLWALLLLIGVVFATIVFFTSNNLEYPKYQWTLAYIGFVVSVIWTYITANEIVNLIQTFGVLLNVNNIIMGLTFLAWGNSIADLVADVTLAKQGFPRMSWSACFGGPLFNILIGVGLSCIINYVKTGNPTTVDFSPPLLAKVLCGAVLFSLSFTFVLVPLVLKFHLTKWFGWLMVGLYIVCLTLCVLIGLEVIHL